MPSAFSADRTSHVFRRDLRAVQWPEVSTDLPFSSLNPIRELMVNVILPLNSIPSIDPSSAPLSSLPTIRFETRVVGLGQLGDMAHATRADSCHRRRRRSHPPQQGADREP